LHIPAHCVHFSRFENKASAKSPLLYENIAPLSLFWALFQDNSQKVLKNEDFPFGYARLPRNSGDSSLEILKNTTA
jgi:hypothetical protein